MDNLYSELQKLSALYKINDGADSLEILNFALEIEADYSISIVELEVEKITDINYLHEVIKKK
jgi:acyl carrier protein